MEFIDLKEQYKKIEIDVDQRIKKVLMHGKYILGPEVFELEETLADFVGVDDCVSVSSGTDALIIALMAIGVKQGDEVITTPFSFIASGEAIALVGAKPVFVDIDPRTYNIDENKIEAAITNKTKAIMPVSLFGQCAAFETINKLAKKYELAVIEDAAQSFGATQNGRRSCGLTTIGCTSFFPSKPLGAYGDGGACFTHDKKLATKMREIRAHGQTRRYHHTKIGLNGRMDTIQAAILLAKLNLFPSEIGFREKIGERYSLLINEKDVDQKNIVTPFIASNNCSVYAQYSIQIEDRDLVCQYLKDNKIPTAIHYPTPLNKQPVFSNSNPNQCLVSEALSKHIVSLPMHPYMSEDDQERVVSKLFDALKKA